MDADQLAAAPEALDRATKEKHFMEIRTLLNPSEREMAVLVKTVEHIADESDFSPAEVAGLARGFAVKGFDTSEICGACRVATQFHSE